jgi:hypothetical protein
MPGARVPVVPVPALLCDDELYREQIEAVSDPAEPAVLTAVPE